MADESKSLPARPPRGMIKIDGTWQVRRYGLLVQRRLTCIFGHHIHVGGRPFEIAIPCDCLDRRGMQAAAACPAYIYIFTTRPRLLWAMDVTRDETELIDNRSMDVEAIVSHFGVGFPTDMKLLRAPSIARPPTGA